METDYLPTISDNEPVFASAYNDGTQLSGAKQGHKQKYVDDSSSNSKTSSSMLDWPAFTASNNNAQQTDFMNVLGSAEIDMSTLVEQTMWPIENMPNNNNSGQLTPQLQDQQNDPVNIANSLVGILSPWDANVQIPSTIKEEWSLPFTQDTEQVGCTPYQQQQEQQFSLPLTPPSNYINGNNNKNKNFDLNTTMTDFNNFGYNNNVFQDQPYSRETTPPSTNSTSSTNSPDSSATTPPTIIPCCVSQVPQLTQQQHYKQVPSAPVNNFTGRRKSVESHPTPTRTYRRRASSHPSVASIVSLAAHEPVARMIDGVEHITFLYSHDRLVKEYTVRTNIASVCLDAISLDFRVQNTIYPRANVSREEYEGNRWEYETSCNKLGWELCWLNQNQLCGRRGLIQRAVDSYRNRHAEMRSRRVTRLEKVANGTLRKRKAKKPVSAPF